MYKLIRVTQLFPILLVSMYVSLFICTDFDWYYDAYNSIIILVDSTLLILSLAGALLFIRKWNKLAITSFITVILLNILTEISFRIEIQYYYEIYESVIISFLILMAVFSKKKDKINGDSNFMGEKRTMACNS